VVDAIHTDGGLAGIHVCANTDWSLVLESGADIVNFDAYAYFDRFILYGDPIRDSWPPEGCSPGESCLHWMPEDHPSRETVEYAVYDRWQACN
jgi:hypothetical protein